MHESKRLSVPAISKLSKVEEGVILSDRQFNLCFLEQKQKTISNYNLLLSFKLKGLFNIGIFEKSVMLMIERHESFRTKIDIEARRQFVVPFSALNWRTEKVELLHMDFNDHKQIQSIIEEFGKEKFDFSIGLLAKSRLLKFGNNKYIWLFCVHHSVFDGASQVIFLRELSNTYNALLHENKPNLTDLTIQYKDYCYWEKCLFPKDLKKEQLEFWKKNLTEATYLELPIDKPKKFIRSFNGKRIPVFIDFSLYEKLKKLATDNQTTLYTLLITAYICLLYKQTFINDITIGTLTANRKMETIKQQIGQLIGFLANIIPFRFKDIAIDYTFIDLVKKAKQMLELCIHKNSNVAFSEILEVTDYSNEPGCNPLFDVVFVMQDKDYQSLSLDKLVVTPIEEGWGVSRFDLVLELREHPEKGLLGFFEYSTDIFDENTIENMQKRFQKLLSDIAINPKICLKDLDIIPNEEHQLIDQYSISEKKVEIACNGIHELFEKQAADVDQNKMLVFENNELSYRLLNERANVLAHSLSEISKNTPQKVIGICMNRSFELIIAMLAVLKVGNIIVFLETNTTEKPANLHKIKLSKCDIIVVDLQTKSFIKDLFKGNIVTLDSENIFYNTEQMVIFENNNLKSVKGEDYSIIPFTSGTTGLPKGILVKHIGWCNWAEVLKDYVKPTDKIFICSHFTFDACFWEIFPLTLCQGASLYISNDAHRLDTKFLADYFKLKEITIATFTPSFLSLLAPEDFPTLKLIFVTGENLSKLLVHKWLLQGKRVINGYGQTEMTAGETLYECNREDDIKIGKPIANTTITILDEHQKKCPIKVWGEICTGGVGLSHYLDQPVLNKDKFITYQGQEMFRTGDKGRFLQDGNLVFKGRMDTHQQIKLYGVRIELAEIEAAINAHPKVLVSAVKAFGEEENKYLCAYIVLKKEIEEKLENKSFFFQI